MKSFFALFALVPLVIADRTFNFINQCDVPVDVYINGGQKKFTLAAGANNYDYPQLPENFAGYIWTDAKGGSVDGSKSVRVGFNGTGGYYWFKRPSDGSFNVGMSITVIEKHGPGAMCIAQDCDTSATCPSTLRSISGADPVLPAPTSSDIAPVPPLFRCKWSGVGHGIKFCPTNDGVTGSWVTVRHLRADKNKKKCLDVRGAEMKNGTPVQIYDCNGTNAQTFDMPEYGFTGRIKIADTNFCLDAGSSPAAGVGLKIWQCYDGLAAQQWKVLNDGTIKLASKNLCVDLTDGLTTNAKQSQTWTCGGSNPNQVWW